MQYCQQYIGYGSRTQLSVGIPIIVFSNHNMPVKLNILEGDMVFVYEHSSIYLYHIIRGEGETVCALCQGSRELYSLHSH